MYSIAKVRLRNKAWRLLTLDLSGQGLETDSPLLHLVACVIQNRADSLPSGTYSIYFTSHISFNAFHLIIASQRNKCRKQNKREWQAGGIMRYVLAEVSIFLLLLL